MGQVYHCWWRICREINVFPRFEYHMFYILHPFFANLLTLPRTYCLIVWVTIGGISNADLICWPIVHSRLVATLCRSLPHRLLSSSITVSTIRFLATDFNTRSITVWMNYTI
jgi:hypothetical protein